MTPQKSNAVSLKNKENILKEVAVTTR